MMRFSLFGIVFLALFYIATSNSHIQTDSGNMAPLGMVVTPHHLATQSALAILREGGTAMEAMVAAAATIAVVYPHYNSLGADSFWLIAPPHGDPFIIEACGGAGSLANLDFYAGFEKIPRRGPKSANTVAGTIGGWMEALDYVSECGYKRLSISRLLADAIRYAEDGFPVSPSFELALKNLNTTDTSKEFNRIFFPNGTLPIIGQRFYQKTLANTLKHLAVNGLSNFYYGELAQIIAEDFRSLGMPITKSDLENYSAVRKAPLKLVHSHGIVFNTPPPTQGAVSLSILGILDKLEIDGKDEGKFIHTAVEATKQAFILRDQYITDPLYMKVDAQSLLSDRYIARMAQNISFDRAASFGQGKGNADTVWLGVMDSNGFSVSFIQSIYVEFGSGVVLPKSGILWQNRGTAFTLDKNQLLSLKPGKKPFHTLSPGAARLNDDRFMIYGSQGGDGQPQTGAAIFHRYVVQDLNLQKSLTSPRWVFGRQTQGTDNLLRLEDRFSEETVKYLKDRGHDIVILEAFSSMVGQAGAVVRHPNGMMEGAFDPRSDGSSAGF